EPGAVPGSGLSLASLEERDGSGALTRGLSVPLLDLAPIPHREQEQVVRESYLASLVVGAHAFDVRLELYSVEGDPNRTIYGVDAKTLVTAVSTSVPPELTKVSYVVAEGDGSITFQSFNQSPIITGFERGERRVHHHQRPRPLRHPRRSRRRRGRRRDRRGQLPERAARRDLSLDGPHPARRLAARAAGDRCGRGRGR